jgi:hypothetical protein
MRPPPALPGTARSHVLAMIRAPRWPSAGQVLKRQPGSGASAVQGQSGTQAASLSSVSTGHQRIKRQPR